MCGATAGPGASRRRARTHGVGATRGWPTPRGAGAVDEPAAPEDPGRQQDPEGSCVADSQLPVRRGRRSCDARSSRDRGRGVGRRREEEGDGSCQRCCCERSCQGRTRPAGRPRIRSGHRISGWPGIRRWPGICRWFSWRRGCQGRAFGRCTGCCRRTCGRPGCSRGRDVRRAGSCRGTGWRVPPGRRGRRGGLGPFADHVDAPHPGSRRSHEHPPGAGRSATFPSEAPHRHVGSRLPLARAGCAEPVDQPRHHAAGRRQPDRAPVGTRRRRRAVPARPQHRTRDLVPSPPGFCSSRWCRSTTCRSC